MKTRSLYYYKYPNVGDLLNEHLITDLFKINIHPDYYTTSDLIAIGSILDRLMEDWRVYGEEIEKRAVIDTVNPLHVWGTGLIKNYENPKPFIRPVKIHALRGDLTRRLVSKALGKEIHCVLGDPGLLASLLIHYDGTKKYDVGIIPHYVDAENPVFQTLQSSYANATIINVKDDFYAVLKQIAECKVVLSTSLHGLIIADSFGIPNLWCEASNKIIGDGYKYRDYYSAFGFTAQAFDLMSGKIPDIDKIKNDYKITPAQVLQKQKELIQCFPYQNIHTLLARWKTQKTAKQY